MTNTSQNVILYRPVGEKELDLIIQSNWKSFPPRLYWQPIFYPVLSEAYAIFIAREWNTKDPNSDYVGYVLEFCVNKEYLDQYETHEAGGKEYVEYWIPSEELDSFNKNIVGSIKLTHEFRPDKQ